MAREIVTWVNTEHRQKRTEIGESVLLHAVLCWRDGMWTGSKLAQRYGIEGFLIEAGFRFWPQRAMLSVTEWLFRALREEGILQRLQKEHVEETLEALGEAVLSAKMPVRRSMAFSDHFYWREDYNKNADILQSIRETARFGAVLTYCFWAERIHKRTAPGLEQALEHVPQVLRPILEGRAHGVTDPSGITSTLAPLRMDERQGDLVLAWMKSEFDLWKSPPPRRRRRAR